MICMAGAGRLRKWNGRGCYCDNITCGHNVHKLAERKIFVEYLADKEWEWQMKRLLSFYIADG